METNSRHKLGDNVSRTTDRYFSRLTSFPSRSLTVNSYTVNAVVVGAGDSGTPVSSFSPFAFSPLPDCCGRAGHEPGHGHEESSYSP